MRLDVQGNIYAYIQVKTSGHDRNNRKKHWVHQFELLGRKGIPEPEANDIQL